MLERSIVLLPDNKKFSKKFIIGAQSYNQSIKLSRIICKKEFFTRRYEEIVQQYEDPIKAIVHRTLEVYIEEAFEEFIGDTIRKAMLRAGDNKIVKEYRNGYRYLKHGIVGTLALTHILVPRNRAGGFKLAILTRMQQQIDTIALLISSLYINGISAHKILVQF